MHIEVLLVIFMLKGIERGADSLASLKTRWIAALERALLFQAKESRNKFFRAIGASSVAIARSELAPALLSEMLP